jgi:hypothetical protein
MIDFFFGYPAGWFTSAALIGTIFFGIRMVTALMGIDADHGGGIGDELHTDSGDAFKVLSIQSIAAFMMGFGWAGLGGLRGSGWGIGASIAAGAVGGIAMVWLLAWLLRLVYDLQASGNIPMAHVIGKEGDVYLTVPARGAGLGRVRVVVDGRQRIYPAASDTDAVETGARVRVERVSDDRTVVVRRA